MQQDKTINNSTKAVSKQKTLGQVFTPDFIVRSILSYCHYSDEVILEKHIIDNSCGDGAFLRIIVHTYITVARRKGLTDAQIKLHLETYIHGIDNDKIAFEACRENLTLLAQEYGIFNVQWDLYHASALSIKKFNGQMDYVVGNPPYVRVHHLDENYTTVKNYTFAHEGMTDLYLAFFELGFKMLKPSGQLCYITPNSWLSSVAAGRMRKYIVQHRNLVALVDLGHFQAFAKATTYTMIAHFKLSHNTECFDYYVYNEHSNERNFIATLSLSNVYIDSCFYLSDPLYLDSIRTIKAKEFPQYVKVKNGFATLADAVFIGENVPDTAITIKALKASTGKWYKCLFPYDKKGKPIAEQQLFSDPKIKAHFLNNKAQLLKGRKETPGWYLFGRTQALADVYKKKLAVNTLVRNKNDFKLCEIKEGEGIYSGLYVTTDFNIDFDLLKKIIASDDFIEYIKVLKKYKSGGYYTFNSKDLEQFINHQLNYKYALKSSFFKEHRDLFQGIY